MKNITNEGILIIIVAPSGSGKSTLLKRLRTDFPILEDSVSHTTRAAREGEIEGKDYYFINKKNFEQMIKDERFIEWAIVHGDYKGTAKEFVENKLKFGARLIFDLDIQGTDSMREVFKNNIVTIFIEPPSIEVLKERLLTRGTETPQSLDIRIRNAKKEMLRKNDFDYCIINIDLDDAYQKLKEIVSNILKD